MARLSNEQLIAAAKKCIQASTEATSEDRQEALIDLAYRGGDQWPKEVLTSRGRQRPTLTINKTDAFVNQITNTYKLNRPGIQVSPVDSQGDIKTAEVVAGLLRHIFYVSPGEIATDLAFDYAVTIGWGYYRLLTDYLDEQSFDQDIQFAAIPNPFSVYYDPYSTMIDGSDARECVITTRMAREEFDRQYPDKMSGEFDMATGDEWIGDRDIQLAEYYYCEETEDTLVETPDGLVFRSELSREDRASLVILRQRKLMRRRVKWCKLTSFAVLERRDIPGAQIPVFPIYGQRLLIHGHWRNFGLVRWLRDPQRMLNYWESAKTEILGQMPKSKWIGAAGQFAGFESSWANANVSNEAYLEYNVRDEDGNQVGPPQRLFPDAPPQGFVEASLHAAQHMKEVTGIYDASLGSRSNETSGKAIQERAHQSNTGNFHYFDHAQKSFARAQKVALSWIPTIYDAPRVVRILGEDSAPKLVAINGAQTPGGGVQSVLHDLTVGKYDVLLSTGPSYQSRRQEAAAVMTELTRSAPKIFDVAGDLIVQNLDTPGSQAIAKRIRASLPPELQADDEDATPEQRLQQATSQLQQLQAQLQQINAYAQQAEQEAQQLTKENEKLRVGEAQKARELDLKMEQLKLDANIEAQKLALQEAELQLRAREQQIPEQRFQAELQRIEAQTGEQLRALSIALQALAPSIQQISPALPGQENLGVEAAP